MDAVAGRNAVIGQLALRALCVGVDELQVGGDVGRIAVKFDVRQPGEVGEAAVNRLLMLGSLGDGGDGLAAERAVETLAAVKNAVLGEDGAGVIIRASVRTRRMRSEQVIDFEPVLDIAQPRFERLGARCVFGVRYIVSPR